MIVFLARKQREIKKEATKIYRTQAENITKEPNTLKEKLKTGTSQKQITLGNYEQENLKKLAPFAGVYSFISEDLNVKVGTTDEEIRLDVVLFKSLVLEIYQAHQEDPENAFLNFCKKGDYAAPWYYSRFGNRVSITKSDDQGNTGLHYAVMTSNLPLVLFLIQTVNNKSNFINTENQDGKTAVDIAKEDKNQAIANYFQYQSPNSNWDLSKYDGTTTALKLYQRRHAGDK